MDDDGQFLTPAKHSRPFRLIERRRPEELPLGSDAFVGLDYRGTKTIQSFQPLRVLARRVLLRASATKRRWALPSGFAQSSSSAAGGS